VKAGDRLVTFGSSKDKPFVPGVPVGEVVRVDPSGGALTRTVYVKPYVGFTKLDIVGVVVQAPRSDPRDTVLPKQPVKTKPKPTPTVTVTVQPNGDLVDGSGKVVGNINEKPGDGEAAGDAAGNQQGNAQQPDNAANDQD
ncbi:rod shape-determining protein MreC, partial [Streptomyces sp. SID8455]|nr:rod shape-determining protein MreC [Streptomyces sp. SID8455]